LHHSVVHQWWPPQLKLRQHNLTNFSIFCLAIFIMQRWAGGTVAYLGCQGDIKMFIEL
jgi:hypothetical protein